MSVLRQLGAFIRVASHGLFAFGVCCAGLCLGEGKCIDSSGRFSGTQFHIHGNIKDSQQVSNERVGGSDDLRSLSKFRGLNLNVTTLPPCLQASSNGKLPEFAFPLRSSEQPRDKQRGDAGDDRPQENSESRDDGADQGHLFCGQSPEKIMEHGLWGALVGYVFGSVVVFIATLAIALRVYG